MAAVQAPKRVVITARLEGRCSNCDGVIEIGQRIEKTNIGWMHEDCPADPPDPPDMRWDGDEP
jgi:hypothetical protein